MHRDQNSTDIIYLTNGRSKLKEVVYTVIKASVPIFNDYIVSIVATTKNDRLIFKLYITLHTLFCKEIKITSANFNSSSMS